MSSTTRRGFLSRSLGIGTAALLAGPVGETLVWAAEKPGAEVALGLVTYMWGAKWDLPTLIRNCTAGNVLGVELRTTHAHGVELELNIGQRMDVKKRFADSPVTLVGLGSNERFDHTNPEALQKAIDVTRDFIKLSHDVGSSGVKVKPNSFHKNVPHEQTIEQIGKSLNVVGALAADYGQQIRLEVHGQCSPPPIMKQIIDIADHPNVGICWNSNRPDLEGEGLKHNFNLLKDRFGATAHIRPLDTPGYPWQELIELFVKMDYHGWIMLEAGAVPADPVKALAEQDELFKTMVGKAQAEF